VKVWFNGKILDERRAVLSVFDHAFLYGDGLYETVRVSHSRIFLWPAHYQRLKKSARALHFLFPWSSAALEKAVRALAAANRLLEASARITLSRGAGVLGLDPAMKSTSMQSLVRARMDAKRLGVFEGVLLNAHGDVTEGTVSNLFFVKDGVLHTPALSCGLLPGVTRAHVIQLARREKIPIREGVYRPSDLWQAQELFLTNSSFEILPATLLKMGERLRTFIPDGPNRLTRRLQAAFFKST
jgi:branched-chain amino acid aminotransferase